jgi:hypothetical protein
VNIIFEMSVWMLVAVLTTGLAYAALLYYRNNRLPFSRNLQIVLFVFRFVVVSLIALLLLNPYLMQNVKVIENPIIILAHDNSSSIVLGRDSVYYYNEHLLRYDSLKNKIDDDYLIEQYTFGQSVTKNGSVDFSDQRTDFSALFRDLSTSYFRRNVGALIIFSDGIYNAGIQPELQTTSLPFPVYTVGLGDTVIHPDFSITDVRYNRLIYNKSDFPVEVNFRALEALGDQAVLRLYADGVSVGEKIIPVQSSRFSASHTFIVSASESGRKKMTVEIIGNGDEAVLVNNKREFYIEVLNQKQQILLLAKAPHPDLTALRSVFTDYFEITTEFIQNWKPDEKQYSLVILHELPAKGLNNEVLNDFLSRNLDLPVLLIIGGQTDLAGINSLQNAVQFRNIGQNNLIDVLPAPDPNFTSFTTETIQKERIRKFPALLSPLLEFNSASVNTSFLNQRIRGVETNYPLIGFAEDGIRRIGYITGTGLWRWRLADFSQNGNHETFNDIFGKTVNYLIVKRDNRRLRLFAEAEFLLNEEIRFRAELYNPSLELVNDTDLKLSVTNADNEVTYDYLFSRTEKAYQLNAGRLPSGVYNFLAEAQLGSEKLQFEGSFVVIESSIEGQSLLADHDLLFRLSRLTGGKFFTKEKMLDLPELLKSDQNLTSTSSTTKRYASLSGLAWFFGLILLLITTEWLLRKAYGSY